MKLVGLIFLLLFSSCAHQKSPLLIGSYIPDVELKNIAGHTVGLKKMAAVKPSVIVFYRGGWCPYCNRQLKGLRKITSKINKMGYQILALSTDKVSKLKETLGKHKLDYILLSDSQMKASDGFGLSFRVDDKTYSKYIKYGINLEDASGYNHRKLPIPSVYIVDKSGKIHFSYVNPDYKIRLSEKVLLSALEDLKKDVGL